jgi:hypothetical protein
MCIHQYQRDCPEYVVTNTVYNHVHLVRMHEERKGTILGPTNRYSNKTAP